MDVILEKGTSNQKRRYEENSSIDSASALQTYLNSIPITAFPDLKDTLVLEVEAKDLLRDVIHKMYANNVSSVALITDSPQSPGDDSEIPDTNVITTSNISNCYIGIISFASMVLWCIQQLHQVDSHHCTADGKNQSFNSFFSGLDQHPQIKQTKVADLAKLFLWEPFFPVHLEDDSLFHVLLLLSKHKLQVVPVIERSKSQVIGFITQSAVIKLLLKSDGLQWFDSIVNSALSEFRFERKDSTSPACQLYEDQSVSEALSVLLDKRDVALAVIQRSTRKLVGTVRHSDISLLLDNDKLSTNIKTTTLEQFIKMNRNENDNPLNSKKDEPLHTKINSTPRMNAPVIHRETDILKDVMTKMAEANTETSFLVDVSCCVIVRDVILEFAPPCLDSSIDGGGFFKSAVQQSGCHVDNGTMICDK